MTVVNDEALEALHQLAYATREWERTAEAVEVTPDGDEHDERPARLAMRIAVVALALVATWLVARALRPRSRE